MVTVENVDRTGLYEEMVKTEKMAYDMQDKLLDEIKKWLEGIIDDEASDYTRIILGQGGYIQIRTVEKLDHKDIDDFKEAFDFTQTWFKEEIMIDYRNVEDIRAHIYEYGFIPKNINEILGNNQVEL